MSILNNRKLLKLCKQWRKRTNRENYYQNVQWLEQHIVDLKHINVHSLPWVFIRMPCSNGALFENQMAQVFSLQDMLSTNEAELLEFPQLLHFKHKLPHFISGIHTTSSVLYQMLANQKLVHLTLLKEPVKRVIACYNHKATEAYKHKTHSISQLNFNDLFNKKERENINNAQAKILAAQVTPKEKMSNNELYFYAKYSLDNCFSLVGVSEYYKDFLNVLGHSSGIKFTSANSESSQQTKVLLTDISQHHIDEIKSNNKVDIQLYEYARSKFQDLLISKPKINNILSLYREEKGT